MIEHENLPSYLFDSVQDRSFFPSYFTSSQDYYNSSFREPEKVVLQSDRVNSDEIKPDDTWSSLQRRMILKALQKANGKKNQAAKILGWGRSTLWRKIKQYKIDP